MIRLLTGDFGCGKSRAIAEAVRRDVEAKQRAYLLVPEQGTLFSEQAMAELLPPSAPLYFEVTNFSRLANTVFRQEGGLSYHYATPDVRTLIMWRAMGELMPLLHEKEGEQELGRVRKMSAAMGELSALSLTPATLAAAAKKLPEGERLREKLEDLSLLSAMYHSLLREQYDDIGEDLDRLAEILLKSRFLSGAHLYVDGFISFTEQQWRILRAAAATCDLTVTLTLPRARENDLTFEETRDTYARLLRMADAAGVPLLREDLGENKRTSSPVLHALLPHLFGREKRDVMGDVCCKERELDAIRLVSAPDAFYASSFIAADIARRVKEEGAQYRDFAIIAHSADAYAGILDVCMQDANIPCFMSKKTDIDSYAAVKLLYTAYAICTGGWRREDVISYLKCGMSGIAEEDIDLFEIYVTRWNLRGRRFTDEVGWNMNPDGYTERLSARGAEVLRRVEGVRRTLVEQLSPLTDLPSTAGVREHCRALYEFMRRLGVEERLAARAEEARVSQNAEEADILCRLFAVLCDALDRLVDTLGDTAVKGTQFLDLLRLMLSEQELARIPSVLDQVTVGSADLLRTSGTRHVYLLGVNEGEFPATARSGGVFSEGDRRTLRELGLSVEPNLTLYAARELFCFARAFATARESVTLLSSETTLSGTPQQPAAVFLRIRELVGASVIKTAALPVLDQLWRPDAAAEHLGILRGSCEGEALARVLSRDPRYAEAVRRLDTPLTESVCQLDPATASDLYGNNISLTQSRIDRYVQCPFSYFCQYVLRLDAARVIEFDYSDAGNLLHAVLERFFLRLQAEGRSPQELDAAEVERLAREIIDDYVGHVCPESVRRTPRFAHLLSTLHRAALPVLFEMVEEFSQSEFVPTFFEMGIADGEDAPEAIPFTLPSGTRVSIYGRIDRVDTYRKGNKTYLRIIDYKSGEKTFSLADIERGLNTQLLVYMISLWKSENPAFRARLCEEGGEILPAGILYTGARIKDATCDSPEEARTFVGHLGSAVSRSGLLLDDPDILRAMDRELAGRYIPVTLDPKSGEIDKGSQKSLASLERMGELVGEIGDVITRIAGDMRSGNASPCPREGGKKNRACEYCDMRAVCRSTEM